MIIGIVILLALPGALAYADEKPLEQTLANVPLADGWKCKGDVASYDAKNLYELIDGEAELYFPYGFKRTLSLTYAAPANPDETVAVEVYEAGSLLDAFGVYSNYRDEESKIVDVGAEGFAGSTQIIFYKGAYFAKVRLSGKAHENKEALLNCARAVANALPGNNAKPPELVMLKVTGVIPGTERYVAQSLLGYDFFSVGLTADIINGGQKARIFVVLDITPKTAREALAEFVAHLESSKARYQWREMETGKVLVVRDSMHKGMLVKQVGNNLIGVAKLTDPLKMLPMLELLQEAVRGSKK